LSFEVFATVFNPLILLYLVIGVMSGMCIGCLPGLTATMGVALVLPLTFGMDAAPGILLLIGVYVGAIYGGSISAILLRTPGTPASAATVLDGYEFSKRGEAGRALGISTMSSFIGGIISCVFLLLISPQLAKLALRFSSPEFFMLAVFGLCIIASISGKYLSKGVLCGCMGILLACVGIDKISGFPRYTFSDTNLLSGINYIPVMIGLFAMSQAFESVENIFKKNVVDTKVRKVMPRKEDWKIMSVFGPLFGTVGTFIGIIPGAGADIAAFVAYGQAKNMSKHPEKFGTGITEGIAAPEAANNGVTGGALIPMLTLGVPGDAVAAIMIGALTVQGLQPGPLLFQENAVLVNTIFLGTFVANIFMALLGLSCIRIFTKVLSIPKAVLVPAIFLLCVVGSYAMANNFFDVAIMLFFGIAGYFLQKVEVSVSPAVLGLILGPMAESHFRRALLMAEGNYGTFLSTPIAIFFFVLVCVSLLVPFLQKRRTAKKPD
jgi:putative tricarboxylic transport membrane protein